MTTSNRLESIFAVLAVMMGPFFLSIASAATEPPGLIFNSDGCSCSLSIANPPITLQQYLRPIDELAGSDVDVFAWCPNLGDDTLSYMTEVSEVFGTGITQSEWDTNAPHLTTQYNNVMALHNGGYDPPNILAARAHALNMEFWPTLRMNDFHENASIYSSKRSMFKRTHPELLLGSGWEFNYAEPTVRQRKLAIVEELCANYNVDGFELDFQRGLQYFEPDEVESGISLMTDFIQQVRTRTRQIAQQKGTDFTLAVRVPESFEECLAQGLDVEAWINQGLVDVVTPMYEGYCLDMNADVSDFVAAAQGTNVKVYGGLEARIDNEYGSKSKAISYAAAAGYQQQGAVGTYLFNYDCDRQQGARSDYTVEEFELLHNLGDKTKYEQADKHYFVTRDPNDKTPEQGGVMQLPAGVDKPGDSYSIAFTVGDNVDADYVNASRLQITLSSYSELDDIVHINLNGEPLDWTDTKTVAGGTQLVFDNPPAATGENVLVVSLANQSSPSANVGIETVEFLIDNNPSYDDAVAYWPFEGTGPTVSDASFTAPIDLQYHGTLDRVEGVVGNAIRADSGVAAGNFLTSDGDVNALDLSRDEALTIAGWVNVQHSSEMVIASKMELGGNYRGWWLYRSTAGELSFLLRSENTPEGMLRVESNTGDGMLGDDEWVHVAATFSYNARDALRGVRLYVNGEAVEAELFYDGLNTFEPTDNDCSFNVFGRDDTKKGWGYVDELAIWKRALTAFEIENIYKNISGTSTLIPGDANGDGKVDGSDVTILAGNWQYGVTGTADATWKMGDFNGDGKVDGSDVTILAGNWQAGCTAATAVAPEPGTLTLLLGTVIALFVSRRCGGNQQR